MRTALTFLLPLFLAAAVTMQWTDPARTAVEIRAQAPGEGMVKCAQSGAEVHYRFQVQLCRRRRMWFDACGREHLYVRALRYDAIADTYRLRLDKHDDRQAPSNESVATVKEALGLISRLETVPLELFKSEPLELSRDDRYYLNARVLSECKGESDSVPARVASVLTLGLVGIGGDDSGWMSFDLAQ